MYYLSPFHHSALGARFPVFHSAATEVRSPHLHSATDDLHYVLHLQDLQRFFLQKKFKFKSYSEPGFAEGPCLSQVSLVLRG